MPASPSARSSSRPAGPTNGSPLRPSWSPGCSPTNTPRAVAGPSPNTVCVAGSHSSQARQPAAAARSSSRPTPEGGCAGTFSWLMCRFLAPTHPLRLAYLLRNEEVLQQWHVHLDSLDEEARRLEL